MLKIYNTLSKKVEEFIPIDPPNVGIYICGPTVYDYFHIGNARTFIISDIIRKYLEAKRYKVTFVMNLTDIDDKIIKKSVEEKISFSEVAKKYSEAFFEDIKRLRIKPADIYPKATENIDEIIAMIKSLIDNGFAYNVDGNIFFNVSSFKEYGKLSGKKIEDLEAGARVEVMEEKQNALDFALWKKAKEGEPSWKSEWGKGRPGWHIECAAMSCHFLGDTIDIHSSSRDLMFPHHENEIAQSESLSGKPFVRYWVHNGFVNINQEKMSKSLGNFLMIKDVLKSYHPEAVRLFLLSNHYRSPIDFTDKAMDESSKGLDKIYALLERVEKKIGPIPVQDFEPGICWKHFCDAMDDDFNTAQSVAVIFDFIRDVNKVITENKNIEFDFFMNVKSFLEKTAVGILGIMNFETDSNFANMELEHNLIQLLIELRNDAKKEKNYVLADKIRDQLSGVGIELKDSKEGTTFKIVK